MEAIKVVIKFFESRTIQERDHRSKFFLNLRNLRESKLEQRILLVQNIHLDPPRKMTHLRLSGI